MEWVDISTPIANGMAHYPGDPEVQVEAFCSMDRGDEYNLTVFRMCAHTGTHVDAPLHYFAGGASMDAIPPDDLVGPAVVLSGADLREAAGAERLLFQMEELTLELAQEIARRRPKLVGVNSMSVGSAEVHRTLLAAHIWIVEGLRLSGMEPGLYDFLCLPLKLAGAEGAPARALLRKR